MLDDRERETLAMLLSNVRRAARVERTASVLHGRDDLLQALDESRWGELLRVGAQGSPSNASASNVRTTSASDSADGFVKKRPVFPSTIVSSAPPRQSAIVGRPAAAASSGTSPKSSSPDKIATLYS